jgi:hypothetical protein
MFIIENTNEYGLVDFLVYNKYIKINRPDIEIDVAEYAIINSIFMYNIKIFIYTYIMDKTNRVNQMKQIQQEALALFTKKNIDYGDAFAKYGVIGVLMRIEDKLQRSMSITKNGVTLINDEGIRDTLLDLHNYSAMALMLLDE